MTPAAITRTSSEYLTSDEAKFLTGAEPVIDDGCTAHRN
jgi:hypothetical protein